MRVSQLTRGLCSAAAAATMLFAGATNATAETITVTDIAGRVVDVEKNPGRIVLGEGRMIYSVALLDRNNPFERVIGWKRPALPPSLWTSARTRQKTPCQAFN